MNSTSKLEMKFHACKTKRWIKIEETSREIILKTPPKKYLKSVF
jgi:hypothetical protein